MSAHDSGLSSGPTGGIHEIHFILIEFNCLSIGFGNRHRNRARKYGPDGVENRRLGSAIHFGHEIGGRLFNPFQLSKLGRGLPDYIGGLSRGIDRNAERVIY